MTKKAILNRCMFVVAAGIILSAAVKPCYAGAWTQQSGKSYHQTTMNYYYANKNFDADGHRKDFAANGDFMDVNANYYMEYGTSDRLTIIASLYYKYLKFEDDAVKSETYGVPDIDLGVRCKLSDTNMGIFSMQTTVKIPEAYDEDDAVPLGNGQYDMEFRLLYGKSLYPKFTGYANIEVGYRFRFEAPADELRYLAELGADFSKKVYGRVKLDGIYSMGNSGSRGADGSNPSVTNEFDLGKLDLVLGYKVSPSCAVELGVRPEIYGRNTSAGINTSLAVTFKQ